MIYSHSEGPHRCVLPPEIVQIIVEMIGADREALRTCSLVAREFTFAALYRLGRHIAVNTSSRLRECASLITKGPAFHHVRSLNLGITNKTRICERDWDDYLIILKVFALRRTLTRLWLSGIPFYFKSRRQEAVRNVIASLTATVNELGLYSCRFSCCTEMISLVRAFPLCTSLRIHDCVARETSGPDAFAELPRDTLHITDLEITSSSGHRSLIDVTDLINDSVFDFSSLTSFSCYMRTADATRHTIATVVASPIQSFRLTCDEIKGFHGTSMSSESVRGGLTIIAPPKFWQIQQQPGGHSSR